MTREKPDERPRRARGKGSIFQRANGTWVAVMALGMTAGGRRLRKTFTGASEAEVRARLEEAMKAPRAEQQDDRLDVAGYLERWIARLEKLAAVPGLSRGKRASTLRRYRQLIENQIIPEIGKVKLGALTPVHVRTMLDDLLTRPRARGKKPLSALTVHHVRALLRKALADAVRDGLVVRNVAAAEHVELSVDRPAIEILSLGDCRRVLEIAETIPPLDWDATPYDRLAPLYALALTTGLRQGELLGLTWSDVDLDARTLRVERSLQRIGGQLVPTDLKTRASRRVLSIDDRSIAALRRWETRQKQERMIWHARWPKKGPDYVFTARHGTPLDGPVVTRAWHDFTEAHGLPHVRFHSLRHSQASLLFAFGASVPEVAARLGHASPTMTLNVYAHLITEQRDESASRIERALSG